MTSGLTVLVTGKDDAVSEMFESIEDSTEVERDRWGRYKLKHPVSGEPQAWTRATTFAKSISDTFTLSQWAQRMVVKGLTVRPDLVSLAYPLDVKADRDALNKIVEDAKAAAGDKVAANMGTARHTFTQRIDEDPEADIEKLVPESALDDVRAYRTALEEGGIRVVPALIERITAVPDYGVAGTLDRGLDLSKCRLDLGPKVDLADGRLVIGDLKTGRDLQYGWNEISIQLALYAMGVKACGVWNLKAKTWDPPCPVRQDFALVMHLPVGESKCTIYKVELEPARRAMELCRDVRAWRKYRVLAEPLAVAEMPTRGEDTGNARVVVPVADFVVQGVSWLERFESAASRGELSALFHEAVAADVWSDVLEQAGRERLIQLEEKAG
jgi:hypothetical protein